MYQFTGRNSGDDFRKKLYGTIGYRKDKYSPETPTDHLSPYLIDTQFNSFYIRLLLKQRTHCQLLPQQKILLILPSYGNKQKAQLPLLRKLIRKQQCLDRGTLALWEACPSNHPVRERERHRPDYYGDHGRSGLSRLLLGSFSDLVMQRSSVPVTLVREPTTTGQTGTPLTEIHNRESRESSALIMDNSPPKWWCPSCAVILSTRLEFCPGCLGETRPATGTPG